MTIATNEQALAADIVDLVYMEVKQADETENNNDVLQNDDDLFFPVGTNEYWAFELFLAYSSHVAQDIKFAIVVPAGAVLNFQSYGFAGGLAFYQVTSSGTSFQLDGNGVGSIWMCKIIGLVYTGGTAGNVQLQWAQGAAAANNTVVHKGSWLKAHKLTLT